jgi:hypothetical protein
LEDLIANVYAGFGGSGAREGLDKVLRGGEGLRVIWIWIWRVAASRRVNQSFRLRLHSGLRQSGWAFGTAL